MGIYKNRLLESAATDLDSVQTPGDVGVDLDQVEKDIMGPDGIEAHRDEVEDAVEGVVGDPIEEAYMAMYESEYNYGQFMKVLGMAELREASMGRDLVLEAADIKGFFANVKKIIKNLFAKVVEAFKKAINYITSTIASDKKLVEKYKDKIEAGWDTDWKAKGYLFKDKIEMPNSFHSTATKDSLDKLKNEYKNNSFKKFDDEEKEECIELICGVKNTSDIGDLKKELDKELRGSDKPIDLDKTNVSVNSILSILSSEKEAKAIKDSYNEIKKSYDESIKAVDKFEAEISKDDVGNLNKSLTIADYFSKMLIFEKNVQNAVYTVCIKAAKDKRHQARKLARDLIVAGTKHEPKHESAKVEKAGLFDLKMI